MSLEYARDHLTGAVRLLATSEDALPARLQAAWDELVGAVDDLVSLLLRTAVAAARAGEDQRLATLADLA